MTGMENVIERAARALWDYDNADMSREWRDMAWDDMGGAEPAYERADYECRARALADAGLLAPTQLREEWTTADDGMDGVRSVLDRLADDTTPGEATYVQTFDAYEAAIDAISRIAYPEGGHT